MTTSLLRLRRERGRSAAHIHDPIPALPSRGEGAIAPPYSGWRSAGRKPISRHCSSVIVLGVSIIGS